MLALNMTMQAWFLLGLWNFRGKLADRLPIRGNWLVSLSMEKSRQEQNPG
jgi:hypothetical protein